MRRPQLTLPAVGAVAVGEVLVGRAPHWLYSDGRTLPIVRGGAPDDDETGSGTGGAGAGQPAAGAPAAGQPRTFDQAELNRVAAREKSQGERAGQRALLQTLGFDETTKPEDAKKVLDDWRAAQDAQKDQATRDREAAAAEKTAATEERRQVAAERHALAVERALVAAGLPGDDVEDIGLLVKTDIGADAATIKQAVEDLKTRRPALFGPPAPGGQPLPGGDPGTPGRGAGGGGTGKSGVARGKAKAQELGWAKQPA